jgi:hypothetical protein
VATRRARTIAPTRRARSTSCASCSAARRRRARSRSSSAASSRALTPTTSKRSRFRRAASSRALAGDVVAKLDGAGYPVDAVAFVGETVAWHAADRLHVGDVVVRAGGHAGRVVAENAPLVMLQLETSPSLAASRDLLAAAYFDGRLGISLFELPRIERRAGFDGHAEPICALAFSPDGATLASADWSHEVRLWDVATGAHRALAGGAGDLAFAPDGRHLACAAGHDGVRVVELATGSARVLRANVEVPTANTRRVAWSPDGRHLADATETGVIVVWDTATWRERAIAELDDRPVGIAFESPRSIVVACEEALVELLLDVTD